MLVFDLNLTNPSLTSIIFIIKPLLRFYHEHALFCLNCLQNDSFPSISFSDSALNFNIDALNLKQLIRKTTFAISLSESRPILTGVSIVSNNNGIEVVATDSYRLAKKSITHVNYPDINVVIPGRNLDELFKILEDSSENVEVHCTSTKALFKYKNLLFQTRLINGVYPNVDVLIPNKFITNITFDTIDFNLSLITWQEVTTRLSSILLP